MNKRIVIATNNNHKLEEFKKMFNPLGYEVVSLKDVNFNREIEENGLTFKENSYIKAKTIYDYTHEAVIADDSGLEVKELNNEPGVHSHRYSGINASDEDNRIKLINELKKKGLNYSIARFTCALTYIDKDRVITKEGYMNGYVKTIMKGNNGFGYDSLFYTTLDGLSNAEIDMETKNKMSHRGKALNLLIEELMK